MQISLSVYVLLGVQLLVLPWELISYYARQSDKSRLRLLTYTCIHLIFSGLWILKDLAIFHEAPFESLLVGTGIFLASYSFYFWNKEFQIRRAKHKSILLFTHGSFAFLSYLLFQHFFGQNVWSIAVNYVYIQLIVIYFIYYFVKEAFDQIDKAFPLRNAYVVASLSLLAIPFMLFFIHSFTITFLIINTGFLFITCTQIANFIRDSRLETKEITEQLEIIASKEIETNQFARENQLQSEQIVELKAYINALENKERSEADITKILLEYDSITPSEFEIAKLLALGSSFQEISDKKHITASTARKHASTIYSKLDVKNLDEFRKIFL